MIATMGNVFYFDWEFDLLYWFQGLHNPVLDKIVVAITSLGNAGIFWILLTIAMLIFCKDKKVAWTSALALLFSLLVINVFLKNTVMRARPCWIDDSVTLLVKNPKDYSFRLFCICGIHCPVCKVSKAGNCSSGFGGADRHFQNVCLCAFSNRRADGNHSRHY